MQLIKHIRFGFHAVVSFISALRRASDTHNRVCLLEQRLDSIIVAQEQRLDAQNDASNNLRRQLEQLTTLMHLHQERLDAQAHIDAELRQRIEHLPTEAQQAQEAYESLAATMRIGAHERYYRDLMLQRQIDALQTALAQSQSTNLDPLLTPTLQPLTRVGFSDPPVPSIPAHPDNHHLIAHPYTLLHVGAFAPGQAQHRLIDTLYALRQLGEENLRLVLASPAEADDDPAYRNMLEQHATLLGLSNQVSIHPKCHEQMLAECYLSADLYLSLSDSSGLDETDDRLRAERSSLQRALHHDLLALTALSPFDARALPEEMQLPSLASDAVAARIRELMHDPKRRRNQLARQRACRDDNTWPRAVPNDDGTASSAEPRPLNIRVEGPYDSSYSLALVNSATALALHRRGDRVTLHNTDGYGDNRPSKAFLRAHPEIDTIRRTRLRRVDVTLRNLYPPRTNAIAGIDKILGPYGWEESSFPTAWIQGFNRRLSAVLCMSDYVRDVLIDNGLNVPAITTGIVADAILGHTPQDPGFQLPNGYRLLHISSGFPRKGIDLLLNAFERLPPDITLIIKSFPNPHNDVRQRLQAREFRCDIVRPESMETSCKTELTAEQAPVTRWTKTGRCILLIDADLPTGQIAWLYRQADQLVAPSRGEGFGLPMAEAMLLDVPVVTTDAGGQRDFCTPETAWLIDSRPVPAKTHFNLPGSQWAEPDPMSLENAILEVRQSDAEERLAKLARAHTLVQQRYSAPAVAERIHQALRTLAEG